MGGDTIKYSTFNTDAFRVSKVYNSKKNAEAPQIAFIVWFPVATSVVATDEDM